MDDWLIMGTPTDNKNIPDETVSQVIDRLLKSVHSLEKRVDNLEDSFEKRVGRIEKAIRHPCSN